MMIAGDDALMNHSSHSRTTSEKKFGSWDSNDFEWHFGEIGFMSPTAFVPRCGGGN